MGFGHTNALRICRAYRSVSTEVVLLPIHLKDANYRSTIVEDYKRNVTLINEKWQKSWNQSIPDVTPWIARKHRKVKFELYRFRRADTPNCYYCGEVDDAENIICLCTKRSETRQSDLLPENIVKLMLSSEAS